MFWKVWSLTTLEIPIPSPLETFDMQNMNSTTEPALFKKKHPWVTYSERLAYFDMCYVKKRLSARIYTQSF